MMTDRLLPLIVSPAEVAPLLADPRLLIVDLCKTETYAQVHIPGAVHLPYATLVRQQPPAMGLLPMDEQLTAALSSLGLRSDHHVVAYDDEGGGRAARLLWTLQVVGHGQGSLIDGGLHAWYGERLPLDNNPVTPQPSQFEARADGRLIADRDYVLANLENPKVQIVDSRSADEYSGAKRFAQRGGHIPGAKHFDWQYALDAQNQLRRHPPERIRQLLADQGIDSGKETIVYCQTHHRSSYNFILLQSLGFTSLRAYPGSWSEWGNDPSLPVEN